MSVVFESLPWVLPWLIAANAVVGFWFRRGRAARMGVLLAFTWLLMDVVADQTGLLARVTERGTDAVSLLIPINMLLLTLFPSTGLFRWPSMIFWLLVFSQAGLLLWLNDSGWSALMTLTAGPWTEPFNSPLGPVLPGVLVLMIGALISLARWVWRANPIDCGLALALVFSALATDRYFDSGDPLPLLAAAASSMVLTLIYTAWRMAFTDRLTGLPSRRALDQALRHGGRRFSVAMIDVDHFKKVNDRFGHPVGDQVLRAVASCMRGVKNAVPYRFGGEEFCLLFRGKACGKAADSVEALRHQIGERVVVLRSKDRPARRPANRDKHRRKTVRVSVTVSAGLAERQSGETVAQVFERADKALYRAKKQGRDRLVVD